MINIVTVQSGWILQKIAERLHAASDGKTTLSHYARGDVDANFYVDVTNCYQGKSGVLDIGFFTHVHANDMSYVPPQTWTLDFIFHMASRYLDMFSERYPKNHMSIMMPFEIPSGFEMKKPTIGIFQRGKHEGKGEFFMRELVEKPIAQKFKFLFVGKDWDEVKVAMQKNGVHYSSDDSEDYFKYSELYDRIDYLLIPSLWEGGPISILEARAKGIPVISADVGWINEVGADFVFDAGSVSSLILVLRRILHKMESRRASVKNLSYAASINQVIRTVDWLKKSS